MTRREGIRGTLYAAVLVWVNGYICRTWFFHPTAQMNSLDGYWAALVRLGGGWLTPSWWRYWDLGIPFEFTSAPMVPAMTAGIAAWGHVPAPMALQAVKAIFYCAAPLALFLLAWGLTRAAGYSFAAGLFYSLVSPGKILAPDAGFRWGEFFSPNRFVMQAVWDETPRVASVTFLMVFLLVLVRWLEDSPGSAGWSGPGRFIKLATTCLRAWLVGRRGGSYERRGASEGQRGGSFGQRGESDGGECGWAGAGVLLALGMLASPFALPAAGIAVFCLLTALRPTEWRGAAIGAGGVFLLGYALTAGFLPPSMWRAMALASAAHEPWDWSWGLLKLLAASAVVWVTAVHYLSRWIGDWRLRFFWLLALAMGWGPVLSVWLQRQVLPQPQHFRMEMEAAIALAVVFGVRAPIERLPRWGKTALVCGLLIFAGQQTLERRRLVKDLLNPADVTKTIEYRTAIRVAREFPGARVMLPGSIAQWANAFTDTVQFAGGEGVAAYSQAAAARDDGNLPGGHDAGGRRAGGAGMDEGVRRERGSGAGSTEHGNVEAVRASGEVRRRAAGGVERGRRDGVPGAAANALAGARDTGERAGETDAGARGGHGRARAVQCGARRHGVAGCRDGVAGAQRYTDSRERRGGAGAVGAGVVSPGVAREGQRAGGGDPRRRARDDVAASG